MEKKTLENKISVLSDNVISKIAAGEVIERPASVLKELIENSIDAGADTINIDFTCAGKELIRVNDNGSGLSPKDTELAVKRHSTSKIKTFEDLDKLNTFGFRGEALYSISAVSKLTIKSSLKAAVKGTEIYSEGGKILKNSVSSPVGGTTIEVKDLFFNVPARKKFLKSDATERGHMLKVIEDAALVNTNIAFNVRSNGREVYSLTKQTNDTQKNLFNRIKAILGADIAARLVFADDKFINFKAFIGTTDRFSTAKNIQFFFVNKRPVTSTLLRTALYRAVSNYTDKNAKVASIIYLTLSPDSFDVNIHPQKKEVRFKDEGFIFAAISKAASKAFSLNRLPQNNLEQSETVYYIKDKNRSAAKDLERSLKEEKNNLRNIKQQMEEPPVLPVAVPPAQNVSEKTNCRTILPTENNRLKEIKQPNFLKPFYRFLGQFSKSYLLFESEKGLLVIDQHAAEERVLFEKYLNEFKAERPLSQKFMMAVSIEMPASKIENILLWQEWLNNAGFEIDRFGSQTLLLHSAPLIFSFSDDNAKNFILGLADEIENPSKLSDDLKRSKVARLACKKAVKAHKELTAEEAVALLKSLHKCTHPNICPHGRPTTFTMTGGEISKKFQRTKSV